MFNKNLKSPKNSNIIKNNLNNTKFFSSQSTKQKNEEEEEEGFYSNKIEENYINEINDLKEDVL